MTEQVNNSLFVAVAFKEGDCNRAWEGIPNQITSRGSEMLVNIKRLEILKYIGIDEVYYGFDTGQGVPLVQVESVIDRLHAYSLVPTRKIACQGL